MATSATELIKQLPDAETIRTRLAETVRDAALLRKMLRLAQSREKDVRKNEQPEAASS